MKSCILLSFKTVFNSEETMQFSCLGICRIHFCHSSSINMKFVVIKQQILKSSVQRERHHVICVRLKVYRYVFQRGLTSCISDITLHGKNSHGIIQNTINLTSQTSKMGTLIKFINKEKRCCCPYIVPYQKLSKQKKKPLLWEQCFPSEVIILFHREELQIVPKEIPNCFDFQVDYHQALPNATSWVVKPLYKIVVPWFRL